MTDHCQFKWLHEAHLIISSSLLVIITRTHTLTKNMIEPQKVCWKKLA